MKKKTTDIHRGQILKNVVELTGENKETVAEKAGYTRGSYYKHIQEPDLAYHILAAYGRAIKYDFTIDLHEMPKYIIAEEPEGDFDRNMSIEKALALLSIWKDKYIELLEKYNAMIEEKYVKK